VDEVGPDGNIITGTLYGADGRLYRISSGIPRFVLTEDGDQAQTGSSFGFKWRQRASYDSPQMRAQSQAWLIARYGFASAAAMCASLSQRRRVLDAGCGSGYSTSLWMSPTWTGPAWLGVDLSSAIDVAQERLGSIPNTHFVQADLMQLPFEENSFDAIVSEGVLHHTPSTELALKSLVAVLEPGGEIMFYMYRRKGPVREFTDDYIRDIVSPLEPEKAWAMLRSLTKLGQALAELRAEVEVPEDIPYLGIQAGRYDVQRLIYWHFAKMFWNGAFSFEENNHVNFDWYHPRYAHRQSEDEVRRWCAELSLSITHVDVQESGITVRAIKA
jgi:SAM-dependent methyltransferase